MECPYCKSEMKDGTIPQVRDRLTWRGAYNRETFSTESVPLQKYNLLTSAEVSAYYCPNCRIVIVPVPEFERPEETIRRKWNSFTDRIREARDANAAERAEKRHEKRNEERRKKDPWEVD